jgi:hypothetical protein
MNGTLLPAWIGLLRPYGITHDRCVESYRHIIWPAYTEAHIDEFDLINWPDMPTIMAKVPEFEKVHRFIKVGMRHYFEDHIHVTLGDLFKRAKKEHW